MLESEGCFLNRPGYIGSAIMFRFINALYMFIQLVCIQEQIDRNISPVIIVFPWVVSTSGQQQGAGRSGYMAR